MTVTNHRATMASRIEDSASLDYYPSPPWWGRALGGVLDRLGLDVGAASCLEPACGEGHLAHGLRDVFREVRASDIHDYGRGFAVRDFLADGPAGLDLGSQSSACGPPDPTRPDWIVTNPPFGVLTGFFIQQAVRRARVGAAMLLQLRLMEGVGRLRLFQECGLFAVAVLPRRGSGLRKGLWRPGQSTATTYAWFIFLKPGAVARWSWFDGEARAIWIEADACDRLTRASDAAFAGVLGSDSCQGRNGSLEAARAGA